MNYEDKLHLYMSVIPINFSTKGRFMLENLKKYLDMGKIAISPEEHSNQELLTELRVATADEDMKDIGWNRYYGFNRIIETLYVLH
jgi:hypothetical protein